MALYVHDLPEHPRADVVLFCVECGDTFSATRGDYFLVPPGESLKHCKQDMVLARRTVHIVGLQPDEAAGKES
jgi:hypothetical protein